MNLRHLTVLILYLNIIILLISYYNKVVSEFIVDEND